MITKSRNTTDNWVVHTDATGNQTYSFLNETEIFDDILMGKFYPSTSSVFYGTANTINGRIYHMFPTAGHNAMRINSKFGSYLANGNANGPFVYCGFKPAWIMIKPNGSGNGCYSGGYTSWSIYDSSTTNSK